jgi:hypothetical protein
LKEKNYKDDEDDDDFDNFTDDKKRKKFYLPGEEEAIIEGILNIFKYKFYL